MPLEHVLDFSSLCLTNPTVVEVPEGGDVPPLPSDMSDRVAVANQVLVDSAGNLTADAARADTTQNASYSLCAPDRMVNPSIFAEVQNSLGIAFSMDAACNPQGTNALCPRHATPDTFMQTSIAGEALWCCVAPQDVRAYQQHYERSKRKHPHHTCAVFVVPKFRHLTRYFTQLRYKMVRELPAGTQLLVSANGTREAGRLPMPPTPYPVQLWYDPPAATASVNTIADSHSHAFLFDCLASRQSAVILVDSGADAHGTADGFVTKQFVSSLGIHPQPSNTASVRLANGQSHPLLGQVNIPISVGSFRDTVRLLVMKEGMASADILLGTDWLARRKARMCWDTDTLTLRKGGRNTVLRPKYTQEPSEPVKLMNLVTASLYAATTTEILTAKQASKAIINGGADAFLMLVRPEDDPHSPAELGNPAQMAVSVSAASASTAPANPPDDLVPADQLRTLLDKYKDVFAEVTGLREQDSGVEHTIPLVPGAQPPAKRTYRLSPDEKAECQRQIADLLAKGFIEPSNSPFGAPVIFVRKKDPDSHTGFKLRMVLDYRELNKITVKRRYPMPNIQELFDQLGGARVLSSIDLQSGYHQLRISKDDVPKTAFITPEGQFAFKVLCFGLTNAPATFQATMNSMFREHLGKFVLVYLDDLLVFSRTPEEHLQHLETVFSILQQQGLKAKLSKCAFNQPELKFLGHVVGRHGLKVDPEKVQVVRDWSTPTSVKQLRSFLGLANFFRRFIQGYSSLVAPLTALTSDKRSWHWSDKCQEAFEGVKLALINAPVLALPDLNKPFEVWSDASLFGTGAVLLQDGHAVAFLSHRFSPAERNYTTTDQEALGVIHALQQWRCYLEGAPDVTVVTDHQPLTYLGSLKASGLLSRRQARWISFLQDQHIRWSYRPGRINVADPLSRIYEGSDAASTTDASSLPGQPMVAAITRSAINTDLRKRICAGYRHDPWFKEQNNVTDLRKVDGLYFKGDQVVVPDVDKLRRLLIAEYHDGGTGGHRGPERTLEAIKRTYWWTRLAADVCQYVSECPQCQRNKASTTKPRGLLQPLPIPERVWGSVTVDLITQLPMSASGFDAIVVFVDRLSKMTHFAPTNSTVTAEGVAQLYVDKVFCHHGLSDEIVSDRGPQFAGMFWTSVFKLLGTKIKLSTAYHPQTDGQTERMNRLLEETLRHYVSPTQDDWDTHLTLIEFAINNSLNKSIGTSPFQLWTPHVLREPSNIAVLQSKVPQAASYVQEMRARLQRARSCLLKARDRQKAAADKSRQDASFAVGDLVLLSTKNIALKAPGTKKLLPRFIGPFSIEAVVGKVAYKLQLPSGYRIHPVFHVSLLKPYKSNGVYQPPPPQFLDDGGNAYWTVQAIIDHRDRKVHRKTVRDFLVKWEGFGPEHNSWEPETALREDSLVESLVDEYLESVARRPVRSATRPTNPRKRTRARATD